MKKSYILGILAISAFALVSCDMLDDDMSLNGPKPQKQITKGFNDDYPKARDVEWEFENGCWVVSFETGWGTGKVDYEAWYDTDGNWLMTKTEMHHSKVPQHIKDALAADPEYGSLRMDDNEVELYETPDGSFYRFDLRINGYDIEVDVTDDGVVSLATRR